MSGYYLTQCSDLSVNCRMWRVKTRSSWLRLTGWRRRPRSCDYEGVRFQIQILLPNAETTGRRRAMEDLSRLNFPVSCWTAKSCERLSPQKDGELQSLTNLEGALCRPPHAGEWKRIVAAVTWHGPHFSEWSCDSWLSQLFDVFHVNRSCVICSVSAGVKHQDSQNSFLAFLNAPTSALDQFDVSIGENKSLHIRRDCY